MQTTNENPPAWARSGGRGSHSDGHQGHRQHIPLSVPRSSARARPPYSVEIVAALKAGRPVNCFVFTGPRAWERAKARHNPGLGLFATLLPTGHTASEYQWPPMPTPLVVAEGIERGEAVSLGAALVACGCRSAVVVWQRETIILRGAANDRRH